MSMLTQLSIKYLTLFSLLFYLQLIKQIVDAVSKVHGISRVLYDLTPKPPATTEWE